MKATESKLQKLIEGTNQYIVPLFQRPYTWTSREWEQLWTDIAELMESDAEHFIGPIVTAPARSVPEGVAKYLLIDGQQRLTTLFILLAAMRDRANALKLPTLGQEIDETLLRNRFKQGNDHFKLLPTQADRESFVSLIAGTGTGNDGIAKCYRFFARKLKDLDGERLEQCKIVTTSRLVLVSIVLDETDNPHVIFESLNSKGRDLTQADLIRNYFLMRVHVDQQERVFSQLWEPIQSRFGEETTEFVRHFLMLGGSWVRKDAVYWGLKKEADREKSEEQVEAYLGRLERFSTYYQAITAPETAESDPQLRQRFERLRRFEVTTAYPLLMALYQDYSNGTLGLDAFVRLLDMIENFMVRRWVCAVPTQDLARFFPGVYAAAKANGDLGEGARRLLAGRRYPRDAEFAERLCNARLYDKTPRVRLLLERIEASFGHKEAVPLGTLTVEHVLPQTLTEPWRAMLGDSAEEEHESWVHTLGNLTLTAYNSELSNSEYAEKRRLLAESHLELNRHFEMVETWDTAAIDKRAHDLADRVIQLWPNFAADQAESVRISGEVTGTKPRVLIVAGKRVPVATWVDVVTHTMRSLVEVDDELPDWLLENWPRYCSKQRSSLSRPVEIATGVFFEAHGSARALQKRCLDAIHERGLTSVEWSVEVS